MKQSPCTLPGRLLKAFLWYAERAQGKYGFGDLIVTKQRNRLRNRCDIWAMFGDMYV